MKRNLFILFFITWIASSYAYDFEVDGIYYDVLSLNDLTCKVVSCEDGYTGDIVIPSTISHNGKDLTVVEIGDQCFSNNIDLKSIILPETIEKIGNSVFSGCTGLSSIEIPEKVSTMGTWVFNGCANLRTVKLPTSMDVLGGYSFVDCFSLESITVPDGITKIEAGTFKNCISLTEIFIPNNVNSIADDTFTNCTSISKVTIEDSDETLYLGRKFTIHTETHNWPLFIDCPIKELYIGRNWEEYEGEYWTAPFEFQHDLSKLEMGDKVTTIPAYSFQESFSLTSVNLSENIDEMRSSCFSDCQALECINIPQRVTNIPNKCFYGCYNLNTVNLPNQVNQIGQNAFSQCNLSALYCYNENPPSFPSGSSFTDKTLMDCILYVPFGSLDSYNSAQYWQDFWNIVEMELEENPCETPSIEIDNMNLLVTSSTPESEVFITIKSLDDGSIQTESGVPITLVGEYLISAYATAPGYQPSETIEAILYWISPSLESGQEDLYLGPRKGIILQRNGNYLQIQGLEKGESIAIIDTAGKEIFTGKVSDSPYLIPVSLSRAEIYILQTGKNVLKFKL